NGNWRSLRYTPEYFLVVHRSYRLRTRKRSANCTFRCAVETENLRALRLVFLVLRDDRIPRGFPLLVAPLAQLVEVPAGGERLCAIHRDHFAGEPVATGRHQEGREILKFLERAGAAHRITLCGTRARLLAGIQALAHALGRNFAGRNCVEP